MENIIKTIVSIKPFDYNTDDEYITITKGQTETLKFKVKINDEKTKAVKFLFYCSYKDFTYDPKSPDLQHFNYDKESEILTLTLRTRDTDSWVFTSQPVPFEMVIITETDTGEEDTKIIDQKPVIVADSLYYQSLMRGEIK